MKKTEVDAILVCRGEPGHYVISFEIPDSDLIPTLEIPIWMLRPLGKIQIGAKYKMAIIFNKKTLNLKYRILSKTCSDDGKASKSNCSQVG